MVRPQRTRDHRAIAQPETALQPHVASLSRPAGKRCGIQIEAAARQRRIAVEPHAPAQIAPCSGFGRNSVERKPRVTTPMRKLCIQPELQIGAQPLRMGGSAIECTNPRRPSDSRGTRCDAQIADDPDVARGTAVERKLRRHCRQPPAKPVVEPTFARHFHPDNAILRVEPDAQIGDIDPQFRKRERLARWRRHQPVDLAERYRPTLQPREQPCRPDPHRRNRGARKPEADIDFHPVGDEIGMRRIADHDIAQPLGTKPDPIDGIACGNPAPCQLARQKIIGDDDHRDRNHDHQRDERLYDAPSALALLHAVRRFVGHASSTPAQPIRCASDHPTHGPLRGASGLPNLITA